MSTTTTTTSITRKRGESDVNWMQLRDDDESTTFCVSSLVADPFPTTTIAPCVDENMPAQPESVRKGHLLAFIGPKLETFIHVLTNNLYVLTI